MPSLRTKNTNSIGYHGSIEFEPVESIINNPDRQDN